jgi:hypothetical protein
MASRPDSVDDNVDVDAGGDALYVSTGHLPSPE